MSTDNLSVAEFATRCGMKPKIMYQYLDPKRHGFGAFRITTIRNFAQGLGIPIRELLSVLPD